MSEARTLTLSEFLLQRIAEDEAVAKKAAHLKVAGPLIGWNPDSAFLTTMNTNLDIHERRHIARHDPSRVLAECEALRRIVGFHPYTADGGHCCADPDGGGLGEEMYWNEPCPTLALLACVYADHPGYDEAWRP